MLHVFVSSSSGNPLVKNKQQYVLNLLSALKIPYKTRDISQCEEDKQFMMKVLRELGKPVIAPQLFLDNEYIGGYDELVEANENEQLSDFLRIPVNRTPHNVHKPACRQSDSRIRCYLWGGGWTKWLKREFTDRKVRGSNPTSATRLPLFGLGQPGSSPALLPSSCGMAVRHILILGLAGERLSPHIHMRSHNYSGLAYFYQRR
ncbi:hypothetical protein T265_06617 [Opisthorchis viverrini]|uniref:Uncharacterized protein n=1 Tax=Opisthorchis viverrini TaxID=6198 RepID=A0A074ZFS0_OPIVI|nr:hypothetical protein T265_06617 [Opisthorchis viverrini]KER26038.1 hypothetical protein T265_06617 [Opisthorchis viverrini]